MDVVFEEPVQDLVLEDPSEEPCSGEASFQVLSAVTLVDTADIVSACSTRRCRPAVVWNGSEYGVAWAPDSLFFIRVNAEGEEVGEERTVVTGGEDSVRAVDMAWTGSRYGLFHNRRSSPTRCEIIYDALMPDGEHDGAESVLHDDEDTCRGPTASWTGSVFGVAWTSQDRATFSTVSPDGELLLVPFAITEMEDWLGYWDSAVGIAWTGSEWITAWSEGSWSEYGFDGSLVFTSISAAGVVGPNILSDDGGGFEPRLVWTGSHIGAALEGAYFTLLGPEYEVYVPDLIHVSTFWPAHPEIAWTGSEFVVVAVDRVDSEYLLQLRMASVLPVEREVIGATWITTDLPGAGNSYPGLAWSGSAFGVAWIRWIEEGVSLLFSRVAYCEE